MAAAGKQSSLLDKLQLLDGARFLTIRALGKDCAGITHHVVMMDDHSPTCIFPFNHMPLFNIASYDQESRICVKDGTTILICKGGLTNFADNMSIDWATGSAAAVIKDNTMFNLFDGQNRRLMTCSIVDVAGKNNILDIVLTVSGATTTNTNNNISCKITISQGQENVYMFEIHPGLSRFEKAMCMMLAFKAFHSLYKLNKYMIPTVLPSSMPCVMASPPSLNLLHSIQYLRIRAAGQTAFKPIKYAEVLDETTGFPIMIIEDEGYSDNMLMRHHFKDICGTELFSSVSTASRTQSVKKYDSTLIGKALHGVVFNSTGNILLKMQTEKTNPPYNNFEFYKAGDKTKRILAIIFSPDGGITVALHFHQQMPVEHKAIVIAEFADTALRHYQLYQQCTPTFRNYVFRPHE